MRINIPIYNDSDDDNEVEGINWEGTFDETMMRRVWEIARETRNLITYMYKKWNTFVVKDKTVPQLVTGDNDVNVIDHDHYTCQYDSMEFLHHLHNEVQDHQLTTIVADYC